MALTRSARLFCAGLLLLAAPVPALAADLCFRLPDSALFLVARPWRLPGPGKCKPFNGTVSSSGIAHGTVCRSADGSLLRFGVTVNRQGGIFSSPSTQQIAMGMSYPAMTSTGADVITVTYGQPNVTSTSTDDIQASKCKGPPIG